MHVCVSDPERIGDPDGMGYDAFAVTVDGTLISLVPDGGAPISAKSIHPVIPAGTTNFAAAGQIDAVRDHLFLLDTGAINSAANSTNQVEFDGMTARHAKRGPTEFVRPVTWCCSHQHAQPGHGTAHIFCQRNGNILPTQPDDYLRRRSP